MTDKQQTFGSVEFVEVVNDKSKCDKIVDISEMRKCGNNAVVCVNNRTLSGMVEKKHFCEMHAKDIMLKKIDYHDYKK